MSPSRILIIRHAEQHETSGFREEGQPDPESLTVRGWQRAGALATFFGRESPHRFTPDAIFASAIAPESASRRPQQTVAPLRALLNAMGSVAYCEAFPKLDTGGLMEAVLACSGTVLIAWEHSRIPACVAALPNAPTVPAEWPAARYDLVWVLERDTEGWLFQQVPQRLLAGDRSV